MPNRDNSGWSWTWLVARESVRSFGAHRALQSAAMLAFYGFLSLMPLLLVVIFLFGRVLQSSQASFAAVREVLTDLLPAFSEQMLADLLRLADQKAWGVVSVVVLMWSMTPFAGAIREAMGRAFHLEVRRGFVRAKLGDLAAVLGLLVLFLGLVAAKAFIPEGGAFAAYRWLAAAGSIFFSILVLLWFFVVFSPVRTPPTLLAGALCAAALLAAMRPLFGLVLKFNPEYGYAFGSLKTIFLLLVWVYYTFAVLLFAAEVMANLRRREALVLRGLLQAGGPGADSPLLRRFLRTVEPGAALFREGDPGQAMFYIRRGAIRLTAGGHLVRELGEGGYFGEMSMLLDAPRTATAEAGADGAELVEVARDNFDLLLRENPEIVQDLLRELADRLRRTNEQLR